MNIEIYTDGACSGNPGPGGWGFVIIEKNTDTEICAVNGGEKQTTNNRMEMTAVIESLIKIKTFEEFANNKIEKIAVYTDSQYVKQGITAWIFNWKKNNWITSSKKPVKNKDLWQALDNLAIEIAPSWNWVKGHSGNRYNEKCDQLAVSAISNL